MSIMLCLRWTGTAVLTSDGTSLSKCYKQEDVYICAIKGRGVFGALHGGLGSHVETGADVASSHGCPVVVW